VFLGAFLIIFAYNSIREQRGYQDSPSIKGNINELIDNKRSMCFYCMRCVKNILRLITWNTICNISCIFCTNSNQCPLKLTSRKVCWREIRAVGWLWKQWILAWFQATATN
jgi:hypothetical protein